LALRVVAGIVGVFFLIQGINWIVMPGAAAEALGMPLLDGLGRSSQIGDMASFFLTLGMMSLLGAARSNPLWLYGSAMLLGGAAIMRTLAWLLHDAAFAGIFIGVEIASAGVLLFVASRFSAGGERRD
jgi:hypothetical protein